MIIQAATPALLREFYGETPRRSMYAFCAKDNNEIIAVWGFYILSNYGVVFSDIRPDARKHAVKMVREAKKIIQYAASKRIPLYATADKCIEKSSKFLEYLGFNEVNEGVYRWDR